MRFSYVTKLIEDRIEFKFHAAQKHLDILKKMQKKGVTPHNFEGRVEWEIEIENLLAHLIGAMDALLIRINDKRGSPLNIRNVNPRTMCQKFGATDLKELCDLLELDPKIYPKKVYPKGSWLKILGEIRNTGMHRSVISIRYEIELKEDLNTGKRSSSPMRIYFKDDPDPKLDVIPYLENSINQMKGLIYTIINSDPLLAKP
jgi:hypothetical protein